MHERPKMLTGPVATIIASIIASCSTIYATYIGLEYSSYKNETSALIEKQASDCRASTNHCPKSLSSDKLYDQMTQKCRHERRDIFVLPKREIVCLEVGKTYYFGKDNEPFRPTQTGTVQTNIRTKSRILKSFSGTGLLFAMEGYNCTMTLYEKRPPNILLVRKHCSPIES